MACVTSEFPPLVRVVLEGTTKKYRRIVEAWLKVTVSVGASIAEDLGRIVVLTVTPQVLPQIETGLSALDGLYQACLTRPGAFFPTVI